MVISLRIDVWVRTRTTLLSNTKPECEVTIHLIVTMDKTLTMATVSNQGDVVITSSDDTEQTIVTCLNEQFKHLFGVSMILVLWPGLFPQGTPTF